MSRPQIEPARRFLAGWHWIFVGLPDDDDWPVGRARRLGPVVQSRPFGVRRGGRFHLTLRAAARRLAANDPGRPW